MIFLKKTKSKYFQHVLVVSVDLKTHIKSSEIIAIELKLKLNSSIFESKTTLTQMS